MTALRAMGVGLAAGALLVSVGDYSLLLVAAASAALVLLDVALGVLGVST